MYYHVVCPLCEEVSKRIDDKLFELRQSPETTEEKRFLSGLQLLFHEAEEGLWPKVEITTSSDSTDDTYKYTPLTST